MSLEYCLIFILHSVMVAFSWWWLCTLYHQPASNHYIIIIILILNTSTLYYCGYCYCNICLLCSNESTSLWTKEANCPGSAPFNSRILKAHSHSVSGGSIWACLECQCYFWTAGGLVSPCTQWLLTFPISKQHWQSRATSYPGYFLLYSVHGHLLRKDPGIVWSRVSQNLGGNNKFLLGWVTK
jgi:hypothetical protein